LAVDQLSWSTSVIVVTDTLFPRSVSRNTNTPVGCARVHAMSWLLLASDHARQTHDRRTLPCLAGDERLPVRAAFAFSAEQQALRHEVEFQIGEPE